MCFPNPQDDLLKTLSPFVVNFAESVLSIDEARAILSLKRKKMGPLNKGELVSIVTGLLNSFELKEFLGSYEITFRTRSDSISNQDMFFSFVYHCDACNFLHVYTTC